MKALSIKQPWAWLICAGYKDVENRDWYYSTAKLPMRIYVHASKSESDLSDIKVTEFVDERLGDKMAEFYRTRASFRKLSGIGGMALGAIIGEVTIAGCYTKFASPWFTGKYGFELRDPKLYEYPIPYRGQLGFFEVAPNLTGEQK